MNDRTMVGGAHASVRQRKQKPRARDEFTCNEAGASPVFSGGLPAGRAPHPPSAPGITDRRWPRARRFGLSSCAEGQTPGVLNESQTPSNHEGAGLEGVGRLVLRDHRHGPFLRRARRCIS